MRSCRSARLEAHGVHYSPSQPDWDIVCVSARPHECLCAHRPCEIWRVRACVRACERAYAQWELKEGRGGQVLAAVAIPAHECAADSLPPARLRASVARPSPTAIATLPPSLPRTASQGCAVAGRSAFAAASATGSCAGGAVFRRAQAAHHQADGRAGPHSAPHPPVACRYGTARFFAGADRPGRPSGSRSAVFSAAPGSGDSACTASDVCCGGTPPEGRMPLDAPPTSVRWVCAMACRKWR
jgi:hypothetical protein